MTCTNDCKDDQKKKRIRTLKSQLRSVLYIEVNRQQEMSVRLRSVLKIPTVTKGLISPLPEMISQICERDSLLNTEHKTIDNEIFIKSSS